MHATFFFWVTWYRPLCTMTEEGKAAHMCCGLGEFSPLFELCFSFSLFFGVEINV